MKQLIHKLLALTNHKIVKLRSAVDARNEVESIIIKKYSWLSEYGINKVVDIGSNDGHFALNSSLAFNQSSYFCFEPIPSVFEDLKASFVGRQNFSFYNYALGDVEKEDFINVNEYSPSSSLLEMEKLHKEAFEFARNSTRVPIKIRTLNSFKNEIQPDKNTLAKIDVQGYELLVINGGKDFLKKCKAIIVEMSFEVLYQNQPLFHEVYMALHNIGYTYHGNIEQLYHPINHKILQADCVFINNRV
jgi:FkbM family methyltransferase